VDPALEGPTDDPGVAAAVVVVLGSKLKLTKVFAKEGAREGRRSSGRNAMDGLRGLSVGLKIGVGVEVLWVESLTFEVDVIVLVSRPCCPDAEWVCSEPVIVEEGGEDERRLYVEREFKAIRAGLKIQTRSSAQIERKKTGNPSPFLSSLITYVVALSWYHPMPYV
jgi:hypothetical protein